MILDTLMEVFQIKQVLFDVFKMLACPVIEGI